MSIFPIPPLSGPSSGDESGSIYATFEPTLSLVCEDQSPRRRVIPFRPVAPRVVPKGMLIVHSGDGPETSAAAFGRLLRCIGHGVPAGVVMFAGSSGLSGEYRALQRFDDLLAFWPRRTVQMDRRAGNWTEEVRSAQNCWHAALAMMDDPAYGMVFLDGLSHVLRRGNLLIGDVLRGLKTRRTDLDVIVTGASAPAELVAAADRIVEDMPDAWPW